jgi:hypothetical protein
MAPENKIQTVLRTVEAAGQRQLLGTAAAPVVDSTRLEPPVVQERR